MYGEKVEQAQELELDLQDVKEMYKSQVFMTGFEWYMGCVSLWVTCNFGKANTKLKGYKKPAWWNIPMK